MKEPETLRIYLGSEVKYSNQREYRSVPRAEGGGRKVVDDYNPIGKLASILLLLEDYPPITPVEVYRGSTLVFADLTLLKVATGEAWVGEQPECLKKKKEDKDE